MDKVRQNTYIEEVQKLRVNQALISRESIKEFSFTRFTIEYTMKELRYATLLVCSVCNEHLVYKYH